ncbi:hypothetical protein ABEB36_001190 [Hypothenemus hampei]|uniref:Major facilitator superfamily associated domain-containing protein n=1 Tax=Hypothenemus hampei TaxID=57062 RepID=A0ABD1FDR4_HYPHA
MKMRKFEINKALLPMKAHYFLWNAGTGPITPYLSVYARQLGFSSVIVGLIYTILPVSGMIAKPVFGSISDRFHCQKIIFLASQIVTAIAFMSIFYSPKLDLDSEAIFSCTNSGSIFENVTGATIDVSLVTEIQKKNFTECQLTCQWTNNDLEVLCYDWKTCRNDSETFTAYVPLNETKYNENTATVHFQIDEVYYEDRLFPPICTKSDIYQRFCTVVCLDEDVNNLLKRNEIEDDKAYHIYQFWIFLILMVIAWVGQAVSVSITDAICFEMLGNKPNRYGYQRMFGAFGWGTLTLITGVLVDVLSKDKAKPDYTLCFYLGASILLIDFMVSIRLKYQQTKFSSNIIRDVGKLLVNIRIWVFLIWCVCVGICTGIMWNFFLWHVQDLLTSHGRDQSKSLEGILMGIQCLGGELPFFFLSGKILKKIGHVHSMSVVLLTLGVRFILYSVIENPWYFIPIECSNGLTFGLFYACMASYASIVAPVGTEATMQGLVGAVFEGVGVSLGSLLAGITLSKVSGSLMYRYFGLAVLVVGLGHIFVQLLLGFQGKQENGLSQSKTELTEPGRS